MRQNMLGSFCLILAASIWGGMYVVSKYVLDFMPPFTLLWLRYLIAFVFLYGILNITGKKAKREMPIGKKEWALLAWIGFIGYFASISLQFVGTKLSDAHTGALITSATPVFVAIFARFILNEKLTLRKIVSLLLAALGVIIVIGWDARGFGAYFLGSVILIFAAVTWALLSVYVKVASKYFAPLTITTYAIMFALLFTTPVMLWEVNNSELYYRSASIVLGIFYIGIVSTAGAFFLWNKGLQLVEAGTGSLFLFFQPVVGSFLGWLLLKESLRLNFFIGGMLIMAGVLLSTLQQEKAEMETVKE